MWGEGEGEFEEEEEEVPLINRRPLRLEGGRRAQDNEVVVLGPLPEEHMRVVREAEAEERGYEIMRAAEAYEQRHQLHPEEDLAEHIHGNQWIHIQGQWIRREELARQAHALAGTQPLRPRPQE